MESASRYVPESFDERNLEIAAFIIPSADNDTDDVLSLLLRAAFALFVGGRVTVAPECCRGALAVAVAEVPATSSAATEGFPITRTTHPSSNLYSCTTSPTSF